MLTIVSHCAIYEVTFATLCPVTGEPEIIWEGEGG
jgi:hypothetical protein